MSDLKKTDINKSVPVVTQLGRLLDVASLSTPSSSLFCLAGGKGIKGAGLQGGKGGKGGKGAKVGSVLHLSLIQPTPEGSRW